MSDIVIHYYLGITIQVYFTFTTDHYYGNWHVLNEIKNFPRQSDVGNEITRHQNENDKNSSPDVRYRVLFYPTTILQNIQYHSGQRKKMSGLRESLQNQHSTKIPHETKYVTVNMELSVAFLPYFFS